MRFLVAVVITASIALFASRAQAAESSITIAVFTKNTTNPAYSAFRLAADQIGQLTGVQIRHYVPKQPDNVDEQKAEVEEVLKSRPDAVGLRRLRKGMQITVRMFCAMTLSERTPVSALSVSVTMNSPVP